MSGNTDRNVADDLAIRVQMVGEGKQRRRERWPKRPAESGHCSRRKWNTTQLRLCPSWQQPNSTSLNFYQLRQYTCVHFDPYSSFASTEKRNQHFGPLIRISRTCLA